MTSKTGANIRIGAVGATTWGTAVAAGAGNKYEGQVSWDEAAEALRDNPIGSGADMDNSSLRGATAPTATLTGKARYEGAGFDMACRFFHADSMIASNPAGFGTHSIMFDGVRTKSYTSLAFDAAQGSVIELGTCMVTSLQYDYSGFPNYVEETIELLGDAVNYSSSTNTTSTLNNVTVATTQRVIAKPEHKFRINVYADSALADGNKQNITRATVRYSYPLEMVREMKNAAGNGIPRASGDPPFETTLTLEYRSMDDHQFSVFKAAQSNILYKADMIVTGDLITGAIPYTQRLLFPCLQVVEDPQWDLQNSGENAPTITFKALHASAIPSGMLSRYPHMVYINSVLTSRVP